MIVNNAIVNSLIPLISFVEIKKFPSAFFPSFVGLAYYHVCTPIYGSFSFYDNNGAAPPTSYVLPVRYDV